MDAVGVVTSQTSRDFPTPGSPTMATTCRARGAARRLAQLLQFGFPPYERVRPRRPPRGAGTEVAPPVIS